MLFKLVFIYCEYSYKSIPRLWFILHKNKPLHICGRFCIIIKIINALLLTGRFNNE